MIGYVVAFFVGVATTLLGLTIAILVLCDRARELTRDDDLN